MGGRINSVIEMTFFYSNYDHCNIIYKNYYKALIGLNANFNNSASFGKILKVLKVVYFPNLCINCRKFILSSDRSRTREQFPISDTRVIVEANARTISFKELFA